MKTIYTTKNEAILVDDEDYSLLIKHAWHVTNEGYARNRIMGFMHSCIKPAPSGLIVDHINRNKLDNQKINLRHVTYSVNNINSAKRVSQTMHRGVYKLPSGRFKVTVTRNGIQLHLGSFRSEQSAVACITKFRQNEAADSNKLSSIL